MTERRDIAQLYIVRARYSPSSAVQLLRINRPICTSLDQAKFVTEPIDELDTACRNFIAFTLL